MREDVSMDGASAHEKSARIQAAVGTLREQVAECNRTSS
jgi:hypothetical protein